MGDSAGPQLGHRRSLLLGSGAALTAPADSTGIPGGPRARRAPVRDPGSSTAGRRPAVRSAVPRMPGGQACLSVREYARPPGSGHHVRILGRRSRSPGSSRGRPAGPGAGRGPGGEPGGESPDATRR
ncbi:hypothetical protein SLNWT_2835 [Streptomyces albus]|uniref:Uncharacterized protein n=1 Tax=Streptomyces albus (strain ATCC 21838 / DSM 41398 / FERM P-419 / JCM 4703 / NBRC 107858) TaxID=1081613 RepID=A0A0B5EWZ6_STRA4|nr:hypothetical protein SLNWT_2835 [Streptomyces albus]AOU77524.1 hypothetical protein SLNHY_2833 [Streptomyces albus]AYN33295.1 hypothetical protein DUI70_2794 [Streptomyces albus]